MNKLTHTVDIEQTKQKLYEKLKPSGWGDKLKTFILSQDFGKILQFLLKEAQEGRRFTPVLKQIFRNFEECPYKDLKVIIVGQDPYPHTPKFNMQFGEADGIPFSCSNTGKPAASLRYMFKEIEDTVYPGQGYTWDPDLKRWSNQGVLLINSAFTTTIGKVGQHYALWQPFLAFLFDLLTYNNPGLVYMYLGQVAKQWSDSVPDESNHKLYATHPASAAHRDDERWDSGDIWNNCNKLLEQYNNTKIIW